MKKLRKLLFFTLAIVITASTLAISAAADGLVYGVATVNVPILNLRQGPDTTYDVVMRLGEDSVVVVLSRANSEWYRVNFRGNEGFVSTEFISGVAATGEFTAQGRITGSLVNVRSAPNTSGNILSQQPMGSQVNVLGISNGWFRIQNGGQIGYVRSDLMEIVSTSSGPASGGSVSNGGEPSTLAQQIVDYAMTYLGWRYVFGGASPATGFDCSGFMNYLFRAFDISIHRTATDQFRNNGTPVTRYELIPGDLVFFSTTGGDRMTHVGMYIGNCEFIHASTASTGVIITSLNNPNRVRTFQGGRRIV